MTPTATRVPERAPFLTYRVEYTLDEEPKVGKFTGPSALHVLDQVEIVLGGKVTRMKRL